VSRALALDLRTSRPAVRIREELVPWLQHRVRAVLEDPSMQEWIPL